MTLGARLFVALQHVLPQHGITRVVHALARVRTPWLKRALVRGFLKLYTIDMAEAANPDPDGYTTFNEFFTRALKDGARPLCTGEHDVASPCDGTVSQRGSIEESRLLQAKLEAKSHWYTLEQLVGDPALGGRMDFDGMMRAYSKHFGTAAQKNLPIIVPGWEDSTLGNIYAARCIDGSVTNPLTVRSGIEYMIRLADWYTTTTEKHPIGFFQIGGGPAGDFPICVVPMLHQDLRRDHVPLWAYFCQISDSTTSYGSYSGAVPNEKITWGKLGIDTPKFIIESDATIVAPLVFAYVMGM